MKPGSVASVLTVVGIGAGVLLPVQGAGATQVWNCYRAQTRPTAYVQLWCPHSDINVSDLRWKKWGARKAVATGNLRLGTVGPRKRYPMTLTFSQPRTFKGRYKYASQLRSGARLYSRIELRFWNDRPKWARKTETLPLGGYRFGGCYLMYDLRWLHDTYDFKRCIPPR